MKRAFSMIELVVVILIIGVLAAVALPKLWASKDDAVALKISSDLGLVIGDMERYALIHGNKALGEVINSKGFSGITGVPIEVIDKDFPGQRAIDKRDKVIFNKNTGDNLRVISFYGPSVVINKTGVVTSRGQEALWLSSCFMVFLRGGENNDWPQHLGIYAEEREEQAEVCKRAIKIAAKNFPIFYQCQEGKAVDKHVIPCIAREGVEKMAQGTGLDTDVYKKMLIWLTKKDRTRQDSRQ